MIWCRFEVAGEINYGIVEGDRVTQVSGSPLEEYLWRYYIEVWFLRSKRVYKCQSVRADIQILGIVYQRPDSGKYNQIQA